MSQALAPPAPSGVAAGDGAKDGTGDAPATLLGIPLSGWGFAFRTWVAICLSLLVAFWLELPSAASAAVTVAILAQPTRGQAFTKAFYRLGATFLGATAAVVIASLFGGMPLLYAGACLAWVGVAVYLASFIDGSRAYGVVLSGYTVAIAAGPQIDNPLNVFTYSIDRAAVVSIGVLTVAVVNDVLAAPDIFDKLLPRIRDAVRKTAAFVDGVAQGNEAGPKQTVAMLQLIGALRADTEALRAETPIGRARQAAARNTIAGLVGSVFAARGLQQARRSEGGDTLNERWLHRRELQLARQQRLTRLNLHLLETGRAPKDAAVLPLHRDSPTALLSALRTIFCVCVAAALLRLGNWPSASLSVSMVGILIALGATNPDPNSFNRTAFWMMPVIFLLSGVVEFLILGGSDNFLALALALLPTTFVACFLTLKPATFTPGFLLLVFQLVVFSPSNPQVYDPTAFLTSGTLLCAAVFMVFPLYRAVLPVDAADRRRWIIGDTRRDLDEAVEGRARRSAVDTAYLNADRLIQLDKLDGTTEDMLAEGLALGEMTLSLMNLKALRLAARRSLPPGVRSPERSPKRVEQARAALRRNDAPALRALAQDVADHPPTDLGEEPPEHVRHRLNWAAELAGLSHLVSAFHPGRS